MNTGGAAPTIERTYSTREVARLCHVTKRALQWWDEAKLVRPPIEDHCRRYSPRDLGRVQVVRELRERGVPLEAIRAMLKPIRWDAPGYLLIEGQFVKRGTTNHWRPRRCRYCRNQQQVLKLAASLAGPVMLVKIEQRELEKGVSA